MNYAHVQELLERRREEYDQRSRDPGYVMYRHANGTAEPEAVSQALADHLLRLLRPEPDSTLVDVGCGSGDLTRRLRDSFVSVVGTDLSQGMLDQAALELPGVELHQAPAHELPFADGAFTHALCYGVFIHFPTLAYARQAFREIMRVLKPGGIAVLGDVPDRARRTLSNEYRREPVLRRALQTTRNTFSDLIRGPQLRGFYPMSFFDDMAAAEGHGCRIVRQPSVLERAGWRLNVVVTKGGAGL